MFDSGLTYFSDLFGDFVKNVSSILYGLDNTIAFGEFTYLEVLLGAGIGLVITSTLTKWVIDFIP